MHIVLEGPDGGGKSTLAAELSRLLNLPIIQGKGPPKAPGEIDERIRRYLQHGRVIFDRHPAISQPIYSHIRSTDNNTPNPELIKEFYASKPMLVYCRTTDPTQHVVKPGEDPAHIEALTKNFSTLITLYDHWAINAARFIYRMGDDVVELANMLGQAR